MEEIDTRSLRCVMEFSSAVVLRESSPPYSFGPRVRETACNTVAFAGRAFDQITQHENFFFERKTCEVVILFF